MLFKNASVYALNSSFVMNITDEIEHYKAKDCARNQRTSLGFVNPITLKPEGELLCGFMGKFALCVRFSERVMPSACVKKELEKRLKSYDDAGVVPSPRLKREVKEQVEQEMLPQAFQKDSFLHMVFDPRRNWITFNSTSTVKCESAMALIRSLLGTFPSTPIATLFENAAFFTDWINSGAPEPFETQAYAVYEYGSKKVTMQGDLIDVPFGSVSKLDLAYREDMYFRIDDNFKLSKISYGGIITDRDSEDDPQIRFTSELSICVSTITCMLDDMLAVSGAASE